MALEVAPDTEGRNVDKDWADLPPQVRRTLEQTGVDAGMWDAARRGTIRKGLSHGQPSPDGFIYYEMTDHTPLGNQRVLMRLGDAQQAGVAVPEGETWIALSCRSGNGEGFTAAMPRDMTLEYIAAQLLAETPEHLPLILMVNDLTAERDHRLVYLYVAQGEKLREEFQRIVGHHQALTPADMVEALQRIVETSSMMREQRRRYNQKNRKNRK